LQAVDLLISARWVIPVEPAGAVLDDHCVAVAGGRIVAVLPSGEAQQRFEAREHLRLDRHALIPGLVNLHTHAAMTLLRGLADDLPLMAWLRDHVWPAEAKHVSSEFVYDGTLLACAEMLRGGVTCFNEMYFYPEAAARAALDSGMRAALGIIAFEFPTAYAADADDYIAKGLAARDALREEPLLSFCMAPHAPYTVSDRTFAKVVTGEEIAMLAHHGASVAHCPSSNLKLASGFAPVAAMIARGVNVGIGTDGAASNNRLDLFQEMRTAALLAKAVGEDAQAMPAHQALAAATLNGARALGLDAAIRSLAPGKFADLCAVAFDGPELAPCYDPVSHLVYSAGREHVSHVWVAGEPRVLERKLVGFENRNLNNRALLWQNKLAAETKA